MANRPFPYAPHDITVTPTAAGYLIGRVLPIDSEGPWWEYLATSADLPTARALASRFAAQSRSRAWLYDGDYILILTVASPPDGDFAQPAPLAR